MNNNILIKLSLILSFLFIQCTLVLAGDPPPIDPETALTENNSPEEIKKINKIKETIETIKNNPSVQIDNIDPNNSPSLPVGIVKEKGESVYIIAIDEGTFKTNTAVLQAYAAIDLPGADKNLAFAAENIDFGPKGIRLDRGFTLRLVGNNLLKLGPNVDLFLKANESYINFDCNGFKNIHIKGEFRIKGNVLVPVNSAAKYVTATVDVTVEDLQNLFAEVTFSPFKIKGINDMTFTVGNATVDLSSFQNPATAIPAELVKALSAQDPKITGNLNLWRGFFLKNIEVGLPSKFKDKDGNRLTLYSTNVFIDNTGFTGTVGMKNISKLDVSAGGWAMSIEEINAKFVANNLKSGGFKGDLSLPVLEDEKLQYQAILTKGNNDKLDYNVTIGFQKDKVYKLKALYSEITVSATSKITLSEKNDEFFPEATIHGLWAINDAKPNGQKGNIKFSGIKFQNLLINSQKPFIHSCTFDLIGTGIDFAGYKVSLTKLGIDNADEGPTATTNESAGGSTNGSTAGNTNGTTATPTKKIVYLTIGMGLRFGEGPTTSISADAVAKIRATPDDPEVIKLSKLKLLGLASIEINLDCKTSAFGLKGTAYYMDNDIKFGKLFYGKIELLIHNVLKEPIAVRAGFGKISNSSPQANDGYKYWFADAYIPLPIPIPCGPISVTAMCGGANYHVKPDLSRVDPTADIDKLEATSSTTPATSNTAPSSVPELPFMPDKTFGLGFKAGIGFMLTGKEEVLNGKVILSIQLNANGGLSYVNLFGDAYMLVKIKDRTNEEVKNRVRAQMSLNYDVEKRIFDASLKGDLKFAGCMDGKVAIDVHFEENLWYLHLNKPSNRATFNFYGPNPTKPLFIAKTYMQAGQKIDPMPALPAWAGDLLPQSAQNVDPNNKDIKSGKGFSFGIDATAELSLRNKNPKVGACREWYATAGVFLNIGADVMILKHENDDERCPLTGKTYGANGRYVEGQVYAFLKVSSSVRGEAFKDRCNDVIIKGPGLEIKAVLTAQFPNPTYLEGAVQVKFNLPLVGEEKFTLDFKYGEKCM